MEIGRQTEHHARVLRFAKALRLGLMVWPAFVLLDVAIALLLGGRLHVFLACRAIGMLALVAVAYRVRLDPSPRELSWIDGLVTPLLCVLISVQAFELDGIASPLSMGVMLILVGHAAALGDAWRRAVWPIGLGALAYPVTTLVLGAARGTLGASLADPAATSRFALSSLFLLGAGALTLLAGHSVWALRRQVFKTRTLGRYRLVEKIGAGGMGEVWRAHHHTLGREVAIKILSRDKRACPDAIARFEREAEMMAKLRHRNAVQVFDYGVTEDGLFYYAMELLEGEDLSDAIRRAGRFDPSQAVDWIRQAADAVAEAHALGIVHRDIKPENLFVCRDGGPATVKVLDFGLARLIADTAPHLTREGFVVGTPSTVAPELVLGERADARSDVYALGVVLYHLLTGARPFEGDAIAIMRDKTRTDPIKPSLRTRAWIPPHLEGIVMRCLARDPADRYDDARQLVAALDRCPMRGASIEYEYDSWEDVTIVEGRERVHPPSIFDAYLDTYS